MRDGVRTEVTPTHLGDVGFEVVECASCGSDVLKREAIRYFAGDVQEERDYTSFVSIRFGRNHTNGWLCPYCVEEGPISLPKPTWFIARLKGLDAGGWAIIGFFGAVIFWLAIIGLLWVIA